MIRPTPVSRAETNDNKKPMSDKLQFVVVLAKESSIGAVDKLKFVGHEYLEPVTDLRLSQCVIFVIDVLQTQRHVSIQIEPCTFACL